MEKIYNNGEVILGTVNNLREYFKKHKEEADTLPNILEELEDMENDTIISINYSLGMGYGWTTWTDFDIVKEVK